MENILQDHSTMYLSTIPNSKPQFSHQRSSLDVSDIVGARSKYIEHPRPQRECSWKTMSLQKSHPKQLIPHSVNKTSFLLQIDDIEGTRTKIHKFTTNRVTNPLEPKYQEPFVEYVPVPEPKFIRDNMAIDDIQGVRSRETFAARLQRAGKFIETKKELLNSIKPTKKGFNRVNTSFEFNLRVDDINQGENHYKQLPKRITNPLEPTYQAPGQKEYGTIEGSKVVQKNQGLLKPNNSLQTADIPGAKPKINNFIMNKKESIKGSQPCSLKRGISSNRKTNPLQPKYNYPGSSQEEPVYSRPKTAAQRFDAFLK